MHPLLKAYLPIADMIAGTFGDHCEVVLYDLTKSEKQAVHVVNGNITGRHIGQSLDHFVKQVLKNNDSPADYVANYRCNGKDGQLIKSSAALIRDEASRVVGVICINMDITLLDKFSEQLNMFLGRDTSPSFDAAEVASAGNIEAILDDLITKIVGNSDVRNMPRSQCVKLVKYMDEKGIFLVKGAVDKVASLLGVSKVTIYSYLDEAKGKR